MSLNPLSKKGLWAFPLEIRRKIFKFVYQDAWKELHTRGLDTPDWISNRQREREHANKGHDSRRREKTKTARKAARKAAHDQGLVPYFAAICSDSMLYKEALQVFFETNTLYLDTINGWRFKMSRRAVCQVRHLEVNMLQFSLLSNDPSKVVSTKPGSAFCATPGDCFYRDGIVGYSFPVDISLKEYADLFCNMESLSLDLSALRKVEIPAMLNRGLAKLMNFPNYAHQIASLNELSLAITIPDQLKNLSPRNSKLRTLRITTRGRRWPKVDEEILQKNKFYRSYPNFLKSWLLEWVQIMESSTETSFKDEIKENFVDLVSSALRCQPLEVYDKKQIDRDIYGVRQWTWKLESSECPQYKTIDHSHYLSIEKENEMADYLNERFDSFGN